MPHRFNFFCEAKTKPSARNRVLPSFPKIFDFVENGVTNSDLFFLVGGIKQARSLALDLSPLPPIRFLRRHLFFYFVLIARVKRVFGQVSPLPFALRSQSLFA